MNTQTFFSLLAPGDNKLHVFLILSSFNMVYHTVVTNVLTLVLFVCLFCLHRPPVCCFLQKHRRHSLWMGTPRSWWWPLLWTARRARSTNSWWSAPSKRKAPSPKWTLRWRFWWTTRTTTRPTWTGRTPRTLSSATIAERRGGNLTDVFSPRLNFGPKAKCILFFFFQGATFGSLFVFDRDLTTIYPKDQSGNRFVETFISSDPWIKDTFDVRGVFSERKAAQGGVRESVFDYRKRPNDVRARFKREKRWLLRAEQAETVMLKLNVAED